MMAVNGKAIVDRAINVMERAIDAYGKEMQLVKAVEEMSELQKELCKAVVRGVPAYALPGINEEMADVEIMLEQLKMIFDNRELVEAWKKDKLMRLEARVERMDSV